MRPEPTDGPTAAGQPPTAVPPGRTAWHQRRSLALVPVLLASFAVTLGFWPGHLSNDSLTMYQQARGEAPLTDWHAPVLVMIWRAAAVGYRGVGLVMLAGVLGMALGAYGVLRLAFGRVASGVLAAAVLLFPPVLSFVGVLSRDVWFADLLLCCVGALRLASTRSSRAWLVVAGVALWLAVAARQNGVFVALPLAAALLMVARSLSVGYRPRHRRDGAATRAGTVRRLWPVVAPGLLVVGFVVSQQVLIRVAPVESLHPEQVVYAYDLAALSVRTGEVLMGPDIFPSQDLDLLTRQWNADDSSNLVFPRDALIKIWLGPEGAAAMREDWVAAVRAHPVDWLRIRVDLFLRQSAIGHRSIWVTHPVIDPNSYGLHIRFTGAAEVLDHYLDPFIVDGSNNGTFLYNPYLYGLAGLVVAVVGLRRGGRHDLLAGWFGLAVLVYAVTPLAPTTSATYRFSYFTVAGGSVCALIAVRWAVQWVSRTVRRGGGDPVDAGPLSAECGAGRPGG